MRIISWNRKRGIRNQKKEQEVLALKPDILILQEYIVSNLSPVDEKMKLVAAVEFPERIDKENPEAPKDRNGMAVFCCNKQVSVKPLEGYNYEEDRFSIPMKVSSEKLSFNLFAVWNCCRLKILTKRYDALFSQGNSVVMGDFNWPGNELKDWKGRVKYYPNVNKLNRKGEPTTVKWLFDYFAKFGLRSAYHLYNNNMELGDDKTQATHYLKGKYPLHIDYCFIPNDWQSRIELTIGTKEKWIDTKLSDHCPLILDIKE